jgi:hypothetical protein
MFGMSRIGRILVGASIGAALAPGAALAAGAQSTAAAGAQTTPAVPKPGVKPVVKAVKGELKLYLAGTFPIPSGQVTLAHRAVRINGVVRPYVPGQQIVVHAFMGPRLIHSERVRVARSSRGTFGHFSVRLGGAPAGEVFISAVHASSRSLGRLVAYSGFGALMDPGAGFGSSGRFVQLIQSRLAALHIYIPQTGVYDNGTGLALDAYHRLLGWGTTQTLDYPTIVSLLDGAGTFRVRDPRAGRHAEGNLSKQLVALANGSNVYRIYPISSGKPSTPTVVGRFAVYSKVPYYLPDGMYFSNFFTGGYAIHGFDPAPDYPASHGCMRVPIVDAVSIYNWLDIGNVVDVYY